MKVENSGSFVLSQLEHVETSCNAAFKIPMRLLTWTTTHLQFRYTFIIARQMEIKPNIQYIQVNLSSWKVWKLAQTGSVPFQRLFQGSTGPTPAQHLLWLPSLEHHPYASICHIPLPTHHRPPLPSTRPLLLPCRWHCHSSWCVSRSCWPSRLRRGPVARAMVSRKTYDAINKDIRDAW